LIKSFFYSIYFYLSSCPCLNFSCCQSLKSGVPATTLSAVPKRFIHVLFLRDETKVSIRVRSWLMTCIIWSLSKLCNMVLVCIVLIWRHVGCVFEVWQWQSPVQNRYISWARVVVELGYCHWGRCWQQKLS